MLEVKRGKLEGGANLPAPPSLRPLALEELFAPARLDYLSFLLDELIFERQHGAESGMETVERLINRELDRWELSEDQEIFLAAILAERHGLEIEEPK